MKIPKLTRGEIKRRLLVFLYKLLIKRNRDVAFTFEIAQIHKLPRAKVGVLDGNILNGKVTFDSSAELIHDGQRFPMHVISLVLDSHVHQVNTITLSVDLRQPGMDVVERGDLLVCVQTHQTAKPKSRKPRRRPGRGY